MNYPYSKKGWMALTLAAVMLTSVGVAQADTVTAPAAKDNAETVSTSPLASTVGQQPTNNATAKPAAATNAPQTVAANTTTTAPVTAPAPTSPAAVENLSVKSALDQALASNTTLKSLRIDIDTADINARLVHATVSEIKVDFIDSVGTAQSKYVNDAKVQLAKKLNALSYTATESKIRLGVQKAYYDLVNAQSQLELKKQSLTRAQTQLKVANASVAVGTRAKTDVLQAEMGVSGAQAALVSAQNAVEVARLTLNQTMGVDLGKQWVLTDKDSNETVDEMPLEDAIAKATKDRVEMAQRQGDVDVAQLNYDLIAKYSAASTYSGQIAKNDIEKAKLAIEDQKTKITMEVTQSYLNLNAAKQAVEFNKKAKESAAESYRLTNLRFENGLATTLEVIQAEEELTTKENQYQDAIHQYHLAAMNYQNSIGE